MSVFSKIFGTHSEHELKRILPLVDKIEALRPQMVELTDEQLRGKTQEFKDRLAKGETLDDLLVEAFAVNREAARRVLGMLLKKPASLLNRLIAEAKEKSEIVL